MNSSKYYGSLNYDSVSINTQLPSGAIYIDIKAVEWADRIEYFSGNDLLFVVRKYEER